MFFREISRLDVVQLKDELIGLQLEISKSVVFLRPNKDVYQHFHTKINS